MRECRENCIANINGQCAVESCAGAVTRIRSSSKPPPEEAAEEYKFARKAFEYYFAEEVHDD